ncbi:fimbrial biogenesis outer membrane usher protein [Enterobacter asburiae]|uniref:fimbria/pilus outer membrane usher protein n=1 Tax=Enterobacter asburiae TaxID=61645 RepID=UPI0021760380|nr:fimbria/pilus outer membrane usher protein [Enterobacter asburiae]MCS5456943.1 fimbrial biogenesis outer membrane usher protein [Enterobacter asburiae]
MKISPVAIALTLIFIQQCQAAELYFPTEFFNADPQAVADLAHFNSGSQLPGEYQVDVYLNNELIGPRVVTFIDNKDNKDNKDNNKVYDNTGLKPCLSAELVREFGIKPIVYRGIDNTEKCPDIFKVIPESSAKFNFASMRLDISLPQAVLFNKARGEIDPQQWDEGINAALLDYNLSALNSFGQENNDSSYYLSLNSGLNIGAWRIRDFRTWNYYDSSYGSRQQWQRLKTYAERTVIPLRSSLLLGESTTEATVFDSVGFRGVQLATEDSMYSDSQRGFAPVIRGMAESNAQVTVRQNGYSIYQTNVAPGAFEIDDLLPVYSSGDLEVSVHEASGNTRVFTVPYSSVPVMQREGHLKYSLTAGNFRGNSDSYSDPAFIQGTLLWGLPHNITTYGGMQYAEHYFATQLGAGVNMGAWGALSADITHADSELADGSSHEGQSVRLLYSQAFAPTGTTLSLGGYRYSSRGFHSLDETALKQMSGRLYENDVPDEHGYPVQDLQADYYNLYDSKRARMELTVSQRLGDMGSVYVSGVHQTYWLSGDVNDSFRVGINSSIGAVNYSLGYGYSKQRRHNNADTQDRTASLSLSVPLDSLLSLSGKKSHMFATANASRDNHGNVTQQAGLSGMALAENNLSWNVSQGYSRNQNSTGSAGVNYKGGYGNANAAYTYSSDYQRLTYGVSGGAILHRNGLTLGQSLGDTSVLVAAPGAAGASVDNEPGVSTDWRGYAIKPSATAYRENRIALDTSTLDDQTEVESTVSRVVPTKGAVVRAGFRVNSGYRMLMTLRKPDGKFVPFGAVVSTEGASTIVGDDGQVYLTGMADKGHLTVGWGNEADHHCSVDYELSAASLKEPIIRVNGLCR